MAEDKKTPNTMGDITNNRGIITQDQKGNNTLIVGPRYAEIGDATIQDIKTLFPAGSRIMVTRAIQDGPTAAMAAKIHALMIVLGYQVEPMVSDGFGIPYFKGLSWHGGNGSYTVLIGDQRVD